MADEILSIQSNSFELGVSLDFKVGQFSWSEEIELSTESNTVEQIAMAFDQLGRPVVFYRVNGKELRLRWYDSLAGQNVTTLIGYGTDPKAAFNNTLDISEQYTDILLHYVRKNRIFTRVQRDRYLIEYPVVPNQAETVARLSFNDGFDDLTGQPWAVSGNVDITNSGFFGAGGRFFGGGMTATVDDDWAFGTGDFTVAFRIQPQWVFNNLETPQFICGNWSSIGLGTGWGIYIRTNGRLEIRINRIVFTEDSLSIVDGMWSAVAVVRKGIDLFVLVNGKLIKAFDILDSSLIEKRELRLAKGLDDTNGTLFIFDGFYVIKGLAQYTSDYEVPKTPPSLWVNSTASLTDGLVFAADFRSSTQPWVAKANWSLLPNTRLRYIPEADDVFLDLTYDGDIRGLTASSWNENLLFYLDKFSVRFVFIRPEGELVGYTEETIFNFHGGHLYPTGFIFGIKNKGYPFFRMESGGFSQEVVSPTYCTPGVRHEVLLTRDRGVMKVYINGTYAGQGTFDSSINIQQPATIGYRVEPTSASTALNPVANRNQFRGFISAIEIYKGVVVTTSDYTPATLPVLRQPDGTGNYLSASGVRLISTGPRLDNRFQLEYRKPLDNTSSSKNRYVARGREYYRYSIPVNTIGPWQFESKPFTLRMLVEDFEHSDPSLAPIVILGDLESYSSGLLVNVADQLNASDVKVADYKVRVPGTFSISVIPRFTKTSGIRKGSRQLTVTPYRELIIVSNSVKYSILLTRDFGRGYWEFTVGKNAIVVKCDGVVVGSRNGAVQTTVQRTNYGFMFSTRTDSDTIRPLNKFIVSEIELDGDWVRNVNGNTSGVQRYSLTVPGETSFSSNTGNSPLSIVNGDNDRWI